MKYITNGYKGVNDALYYSGGGSGVTHCRVTLWPLVLGVCERSQPDCAIPGDCIGIILIAVSIRRRMATIQLVINIVFSTVFLGCLCATTYLFYRAWQSFVQLIEAMQANQQEQQATILENSRKNVETIGELAKLLEMRQQPHEPPS
jgi:hypothetical protein